MTSMDTVDSEIAEAEQSISELESHVHKNLENIDAYRQMAESEFTHEYIGRLMRANFQNQDEIDRLKKRRRELLNYRFHKGEWWKCPSCDTTNPPHHSICDSCI